MDNVLLPDEASPSTKKATNFIGGLLVLYFAAVVIIEVIMGTKSYSAGHIFIAIGVLGIMGGSGLLLYWYTNDRTDEMVMRVAAGQMIMLFIMSIGLFMLATIKSPGLQCITNSDSETLTFHSPTSSPDSCMLTSLGECWAQADSCLKYSGTAYYCGRLVNGTICL